MPPRSGTLPAACSAACQACWERRRRRACKLFSGLEGLRLCLLADALEECGGEVALAKRGDDDLCVGGGVGGGGRGRRGRESRVGGRLRRTAGCAPVMQRRGGRRRLQCSSGPRAEAAHGRAGKQAEQGAVQGMRSRVGPGFAAPPARPTHPQPTTIVLPSFSGRLATSTAALTAAPALMPTW